MDCERYEDALIDKATGASAPAELERHLGGCARCTSRLERLASLLSSVDRTLEGELQIEPSAECVSSLRRRLAHDRASRARVGRFLIPAAAAACVALTLVALVARRAAPPPPPRAAGPPPIVERLRSEAVPAREARTVARRTAPFVAPAPRPEVLIPAGTEEAVLKLSRSLRRREVEIGSLVASAPDAVLSEPKDLTFMPLEPPTLDVRALPQEK